MPALSDPLQECVEGFVFVRSPPRFLLLRRTPGRGGFWQSVSGRVEPRDASREAAVLREVREETGFHAVGPPKDLGWEFLFQGRDGRPWRVRAFGVEVATVTPPRLSEEHEAYVWLPYAEAWRRLDWPDNREALRRLAARVLR